MRLMGMIIRDGLPPELTEEERWLPRIGEKHAPTGWNLPKNWKALDDIQEDQEPIFNMCGTDFLIIDGDHIAPAGKIYPEAKDILQKITGGLSTYAEWSQSGSGLHIVYDLSEYRDEFQQMTGSGYYNLPLKCAEDAHIEFYFNTAHLFRFTGKKNKSSIDRVTGGEDAAEVARRIMKLLEEHNGCKPSHSKSTNSEALPERIPEGQRHYFIVRRCGELVNRLGDRASTSAVLAMVESDLFEYCENPDNVDLKDFRKKYRKTIEKFQANRQQNSEDPNFWSYSLKAWKKENPGQQFDPAVTTWDEVRECGERARASGWEPGTYIAPWDDPANWFAQCDFTEKGKLKSTFSNYCKIMENDDSLKGRIFYNSFDGRVMLRGFHWNYEPHPIRDVDLYQIRRYFSDHYQISGKDDVKQAIEVVASEHETHPIREILTGLEWDGVPRIADLFPKYLGAERSDYTTHITKLFLYGAIQRVMNPGVKFDICVVLKDTEQGGGKSTMCRFLALKDQYFTDQVKDMGDDKKTYEIIRGKWVCELGEMLVATKTKDVESIKSFLSRKDDDYRDPYSVYSEQRPRQCVFIGTSNKPEFLPEDKTGQRRFAPIFCDKHKAEVHPLQNEEEAREYVRQVYAEAMIEGEREGWPLDYDHRFDDLLNQFREVSTPEDTNVGLIQEWLENTERDIVCTRMVWDGVFPGTEPSRFQLRDVADILNLQIDGWEPYGGKGHQKKYKFVSKKAGEKAYGVQRAWARKVALKNDSEGNHDARQPDFMTDLDDSDIPFD